MTMPVRRDPRTGSWFFRKSITTPDGRTRVLYGTAGAGPYLDLAPTLRERVTEIDYIDMRFDDRIYVRPTRESQKLEVRSKKAK